VPVGICSWRHIRHPKGSKEDSYPSIFRCNSQDSFISAGAISTSEQLDGVTLAAVGIGTTSVYTAAKPSAIWPSDSSSSGISANSVPKREKVLSEGNFGVMSKNKNRKFYRKMMGGDSISIYRENLDISAEHWLGLLKDNIVFKDDDIALVKALYNCRGCREKASVLAAILGVSGHPVLNLQIGRLGKRIVDRLPDVKFPSRENGSIRYWHIPFWAEDAEKKGQYIWELRPELKEAIEQLLATGKTILVDSKENTMIAEEIPEEELKSLFEGAKKQITVNAYERNPQARKVCIEYYGAACQICWFDFGKFYGNQFEGIIHVHHRNPISELKDNYQVNPKEDLIPICPNCHSAIHSRTPPYSPEELKCMIKYIPNKKGGNRYEICLSSFVYPATLW